MSWESLQANICTRVTNSAFCTTYQAHSTGPPALTVFDSPVNKLTGGIYLIAAFCGNLCVLIMIYFALLIMPKLNTCSVCTWQPLPDMLGQFVIVALIWSCAESSYAFLANPVSLQPGRKLTKYLQVIGNQVKRFLITLLKDLFNMSAFILMLKIFCFLQCFQS